MREDNDLTQKQMAEILHCSQQVYSNYELGQRDIPTAILIALAKHYKTSTDYILGLTDKKWPLKFFLGGFVRSRGDSWIARIKL